MPWDTDIDVMVDESGIDELGSWWNMSVHHFTSQDLGLTRLDDPDDIVTLETGDITDKRDIERISKHSLHSEVFHAGKKYLLEVNPHYANASTKDTENVIDARWVDTATGLFIDITTVHVQPIPLTPTTTFDITDSEAQDDLQLYTKDQHAYTSPQIFPLRTSSFENITVHIPFAYEELLLEEYGAKAITERRYKDFRFDEERKEWIGEIGFGKWVDETDEEEVITRLQAAREKMDYLERVEGRMREAKGEGRFEDGA